MLAGTDLDNSTPYAVTVWQDTLIWSQLSSAGGEVAGSIFSRQLNGKVDTLYANNSLYPYDLVPAFSGHNFSGEWWCGLVQRGVPVGAAATVVSCAALCLQRPTHAKSKMIAVRSVWCCPPLKGGVSASLARRGLIVRASAPPVSWGTSRVCLVCVDVCTCECLHSLGWTGVLDSHNFMSAYL